jgi:hypothetical protein
MIRDFLNTPPFTIVAAVPEGSPPRRISNKQFKKPLPAVPRRGLEAGFHRIHYDFHVFCANTLFMPVSTDPFFHRFFNQVPKQRETASYFQQPDVLL